MLRIDYTGSERPIAIRHKLAQIKYLQQLIRKWTRHTESLGYQPVRHAGDGLTDGEPERAEAEEAERRADEQHEPRREAVAQHAGDDPEVIADVVGDAEHGELPLVVAQHRLERRRVEGERVRVARRHLHPHRRSQPHPRRPRALLHLHVAARHLFYRYAARSPVLLRFSIFFGGMSVGLYKHGCP
jgi:hypothetical protein